jgi:flagellar basal-body rod protein FlgB
VNDVDSAFQIPVRVLDWTAARARALQTNLANASVPGYRRVDVDFAALAKAVRDEQEKGKAGALAKVQPTIAPDATATAGPNGNTVAFETEQVQIDKNSLLHELATFVVNGKLNTLRSAIRGSAS